MPWMIGAGSAVAGIGSGILGSIGANKQVQAMRDALNFQKQVYGDTQKNLAPYRDFGNTQLNALTDFLNNKNPSDYIDPGYQFRLNAGTNAINNNAASTGMIQSGDTLRALEEYGQNMGSQEYNNAFNRFLGEGQFRQGLAGMGQNAATNQGYIGNQAAGNVGNITANTPYAAPWQVGANMLGGLAGAGFNQFARMMKPAPAVPAFQDASGPNVFADPFEGVA